MEACKFASHNVNISLELTRFEFLVIVNIVSRTYVLRIGKERLAGTGGFVSPTSPDQYDSTNSTV